MNVAQPAVRSCCGIGGRLQIRNCESLMISAPSSVRTHDYFSEGRLMFVVDVMHEMFHQYQMKITDLAGERFNSNVVQGKLKALFIAARDFNNESVLSLENKVEK